MVETDYSLRTRGVVHPNDDPSLYGIPSKGSRELIHGGQEPPSFLSNENSTNVLPAESSKSHERAMVMDAHMRMDRMDAIPQHQQHQQQFDLGEQSHTHYKMPSMIWLLCVVGIMTFCPCLVFYFWMSLEWYNGALTGPIGTMVHMGVGGALESWWNRAPTITWTTVQLYVFWFCLQALLMVTLPSKKWTGKVTFAGNQMEYTCVNGLYAWIVSHVLFLVGSIGLGLFKPTIIYDNWGSLMLLMQLMGFTFTFLFYVKGRLWPTCSSDTRHTGNLFYDLYWGLELNPRLMPGTKQNSWFDIKLFMNGRPGIVAWTMINMSCAFKQYENLGYVTNSMLLVNFLHAVYVLDFFYHEAWYIGTIDIIHDRMGFYLAWGDLCWLPCMYTLQSFYLVKNPLVLDRWVALALLTIGLTGYYIFRAANNQKDYFRTTNGERTIWNVMPEWIPATYMSGDGMVHDTKILCSGFWGLSRHFNYLGDLMMCFAFCAACGVKHLLPHFYLLYMTILLVQRGYRDDERCELKYGAAWREYQKRVPYRIIPYVY